jgi:hypothetical protein
MCSITDVQLDAAAEVIERHVRDALATGASLRDATVYAAGEIQQLWGLGYLSEDPSLNEAPTINPN